MSGAWRDDSLAAALGFESSAGAERTGDGVTSGRAEATPCDTPPARLLVGPYRAARDAAMDWWEREYTRALSARNGGDSKRMAAEAEISASYLWKITKR